MTNAQALRWAYDIIKKTPDASHEAMVLIERLAKRHSEYEELHAIFRDAQESLEDAKDQVVEP